MRITHMRRSTACLAADAVAFSAFLVAGANPAMAAVQAQFEAANAATGMNFSKMMRMQSVSFVNGKYSANCDLQAAKAECCGYLAGRCSRNGSRAGICEAG